MIYEPISDLEFQLYEEGNMPSNYVFTEDHIRNIVDRIKSMDLLNVSEIELLALANYKKGVE